MSDTMNLCQASFSQINVLNLLSIQIVGLKLDKFSDREETSGINKRPCLLQNKGVVFGL